MSLKVLHQVVRVILRSKLSIITLVTFFILFQFYFFNSQPNNDLYYLKGTQDESQIIQRLKNLDTGTKVFLNDNKNDISSSYTDLIKDYGETFYQYPYQNKCSIYFNHLYQKEHTWSLTDFHDLPYDGTIFEKEGEFLNNKLKEHKEQHFKDMTDDQFNEYAKKENLIELYKVAYKKVVQESKSTERKLIDASTHLRVYGACYLDQYGQHNDYESDAQFEKDCLDIEMRMFPWLSRRLPTYKRWDGTELKTLPDISKYTNQIDDYNPILTNCYMKNLKHQLNGRGITISAKDDHFDILVGLFSLLRSLGNKLPIEIVHKDFNPSNKTQVNELFPKIELWFVDVQNAISQNYRDKFNAYANKLLAYFFNSFKDCILLDADTVPVVDLESKIFDSEEYKKQGAFFFKDRELFYQGIFSDRKFFAKLMPTNIDTGMFKVPKATDKTLKNRFIGGRFLHYMEAGVVAIDKAKHFTGVLTTLQLQIWAPAASKVWGDKELFWLGLSISGDEDYYMNELAAGSVGQLTPKRFRTHEDKELIGRELCSTHPAHVSSVDNSTLLWFNSGYQYCKKDTANEDYDESKLYQKMFPSKDDLNKYYKDTLKVEAVIIPKHAEYHVGNDIGENPRGWGMKHECGGYMFCSFDKVGGKDDPVSNGLLLQFNETQQKIYDYHGSVWINGNKIFYDPTTKK
ncbi:unnamed protein product [Wickerhamomyces anomalus]